MRTLLVSVALIGLAAVAGAIVVGTRVFEGTVTRNPYERGIAWDEERRRREDAGLRAAILTGELRRGENDLLVGVYDGEGRPVDDASVEIRVLRPSSSAYDRAYRFARREDGLFRGVVSLPLPGRWFVDVGVERDGRPLELRLEIRVGE